MSPGETVRITGGWFTGLSGVVTRCGPSKAWPGIYLVNVALSPAELDRKIGKTIPWILDEDGRVEMTFNSTCIGEP